jgi:pimeloyl-ACP methyl ester carboxylesterase
MNSQHSDLVYFIERGSGPPLLLVHGLMVTGEVFEPIIERFAPRYRVIVPDLRGHGRSKQLPPPYTAAQLASDLVGLLDRLGITSTAMLGYSQGVLLRSRWRSTTLNTAVDSCLHAPTPSTWRAFARSSKAVSRRF